MRNISLLLVSLLVFSTLAVSPASPQQTTHRASSQKQIPLLNCWGAPNVLRMGPLRFCGTYLTYVQSNSPAERAGLRPADTILKINRIETPTPEALNHALSRFSKVTLMIEYARSRSGGRGYEGHQTSINQGGGFGTVINSNPRVIAATPAPNRPLQEELEAHMLKLVIQDRIRCGVPAANLKHSSGLARMARSYADDMAKRNFKGHTDPEGRNPWERAKLAGLNTHDVRENASYPGPQPNALDMVAEGEKELMDSPHHRPTILAGDAVCVGIGIAYRNDGGLICVQVFSGDEIP